MTIGRRDKFGPLPREAEPEKPVSLGQGEGGEPMTNIGLLAQILAACELSMHRQANRRRRHAGTLHPIISPVVARQTHRHPRNMLNQGLTEAIVAEVLTRNLAR
jgi:hypothetical protein